MIRRSLASATVSAAIIAVLLIAHATRFRAGHVATPEGRASEGNTRSEAVDAVAYARWQAGPAGNMEHRHRNSVGKA